MAWINLTNLTQAVAEIKAYCVAAFKPDWNEHDSTSTKYIANRPFYHDYDTDTVLADTAFSTNYADYDITVSGYDYALISECENVTLAKDIAAGTSYHVKAGISGGYEADVTAGQSTTYTLRGTGSSTKTVTGIPLVVTGYCIIVRTASKKATILLAGRANQYPVTGQAIGIGEVTVDDLQTIDPEFLPAATSSAYGAVKVDTALSAYSHNPVENQAVKTALNDKLDERDYLAGMTWDYLEAHFTWDDLDGTSTSGDDTYTTNLNLTKPGHLSTAAINNDLDILDSKIGAVGNTSLQSQVTSLSSAMSQTLNPTQASNVEEGEAHLTKYGNLCILTGSILFSSTVAASTILFTVPDGYRPSSTVYGSMFEMAGGTPAPTPDYRIFVNSNGEVKQGGTNYFKGGMFIAVWTL